MLAQQKQEIVALFQAALAPIVAGTDLTPNIVLERPRDPTHGDVACNIAMQLAKPLKTNPRELATRLVAALQADPQAQGLVASAEIAGPGFINLRLASAAKQSVARTVLEQGAAYGRGDGGAGHHVIIEFVSANPTGPLHVGHGRQAALGDSLSALFESQGHKVTREFYYNDAGVQIATLATSVQARARGFKPGDAEWPESAYNGDYIQDIADDFLAKKTVSASDGSRPAPAATPTTSNRSAALA
jgi:arginyl-tRNA synthetase